MHLTFSDVNHAFKSIVEGIQSGIEGDSPSGIEPIETIETPSRNGPVLQIPEPLLITYKNPRQRVLFNTARDCNPFFHMYEALWMLSGRNDVASLKYYASKISDYSDDGETFNGAYGYRWKHSQVPDHQDWESGDGVDQLTIIIDHLKRKPESRRVVLQMWNVEDDLLKIDSSKDVCCNTSVMFSIRTEWCPGNGAECLSYTRHFLDMTVINRSNDIIWGMLGANYVHFTFLQEYIACALGVEVGLYHLFTNNAHIYTENNSGFKSQLWLSEYEGEFDSYGRNVGEASLMFGEGEHELFDKEVREFVELHSKTPDYLDGNSPRWKTRFLDRVAQPAMDAFHLHKLKRYHDALVETACIEARDWRLACTNWIQKRKINFEKKGAKVNE